MSNYHKALVVLVLIVSTHGCKDESVSLEQDSTDSAAAVPAGLVEASRSGTRKRIQSGPLRSAPRRMELENEHPWPEYPRRLSRSSDAETREAGPLLRSLAGPRTMEMPVFYGLLHAHTWYSDGTGTPMEAFERARAVGLDFLAVTPHNHAHAETLARGARRDGLLIATNKDLYEGESDLTVTRNWRIEGESFTETITSSSVIKASELATTDTFVALYGQEFSSISKGNHVNIFGWDKVVTVPNGDFRGFYELLGGAENEEEGHVPLPVAQMNHPGIHNDLFYGGNDEDRRRKMFNDYGFDDYDRDFSKLVEAADPLIVITEILTGPAFAEIARERFHYKDHENDYYYYLVQGFHISPSVGHDNHFRTWGDATPARMGVYAKSLTADNLFAGMRANRTFASEDSDLKISFLLNDQPMGSVLMLDAGAAIIPSIEIEDPDEPVAETVVELIYGDIVPQDENSLDKWVPEDGLTESLMIDDGGEVRFSEYLASGNPEFFYVRVTLPDGERAWTAPVWVNHPRNYEVD